MMTIQKTALLALGVIASVTAQGQVCFNSPFNAYSRSNSHTDIVAVDMNGDGILDLVAPDHYFNRVSVILGAGVDGNGNPQYAQTVGQTNVGDDPYRLFVADFDNDGDADVAVTNNGNGANTVTVLRNNGLGGLTVSATHAVGTSPRAITGADFNGDGNIDLAVGNVWSDNISLLWGQGDGTFNPGQPVSLGQNFQPVALAAGDFNDDGKMDIAAATNNNWIAYLTLVRGDGTGGFIPGAPQNTNLSVTGSYLANIDTADFNRDGITDIVLATHAGFMARYPMIVMGSQTGFSGAFTSVFTTAGINTQITGLSCADFNGDGNPDIALVHPASGGSIDSVRVLLCDAKGEFPVAAQVSYGSLQTINSSFCITSGDLNNDGRPDLAVGNNVIVTQSNYDLYTLVNRTPYFNISGDSLLCDFANVTLQAQSTENLTYGWLWQNSVTPVAGNSVTFNANQQNNYFSVTGNTGMGCYNRSFGVVRVDQVNISVTNTPDTVLTAHASNTAFQWLHCTAQGDTIIPGATGQSFTPDSSGDYRVVVTNAYGCTDTSACRSVIIPQNPNNPGNPGVGLDDAQAGKALRIYPNPASGAFTVEYPGGVQAVAVLDLAGRVVQRIGGNGAQALTVNFDAPAGVYILRIETPEGTYTQRLLSE